MAEDKVEVLRAGCFFCHVRCGVLVTKVNGRITNIEGDPDCPHNKGYTCSRLDKQRYLEGFVYNPNRLKKPLKRVGERGGGQWEETRRRRGAAGTRRARLHRGHGAHVELAALQVHEPVRQPEHGRQRHHLLLQRHVARALHLRRLLLR